MIKIIKQELNLSQELERKIEWACKFTNTTPIIKNGSLLKLEPTNIAYIEPHRVIINNTLYLLFNNSEFAYIGSLNNKIKLSELKAYIKKHS